MSQRNRFLIDPQVQWALTRRSAIHWGSFFLILTLLSVTVQLVFAPAGQSLSGITWAAIQGQSPVWLIMIAMVPLYLRDTVKLSHRFVGPMTRLRSAITQLADGEQHQHIGFRPGDFWMEAADEFNRLYDRHTELRDRCEALEAELAELRERGAVAAE